MGGGCHIARSLVAMCHMGRTYCWHVGHLLKEKNVKVTHETHVSLELMVERMDRFGGN